MSVPATDPTTAPRLRLGLIGCGYVSKYHVASARAMGLPIVAACDQVASAAARVAAQTGATPFASVEALLAARAVDAVIIATPHVHHAAIAVAALEAGLHVLIEKPLTVSAADAARVVDCAARHAGRACAVNFNHRAWPLWTAIKRLLDGGELGRVRRYQWTITEWYRTQHYYDTSTWRGTWAGEGGGLLVNQCPHQLDLLCWLFGPPTRVLADVRFGKHHRIEVEDEVHAVARHADGATGSFIASTGEPCGVNRLEIVGDLGIMRVASDDAFEWTRFAVDAPTNTATNASRGDPPPHATRTVRVDAHADEYVRVLANFADACAGVATPLATAADAAASVGFANAILLSAAADAAVDLPAPAGAFDALLTRLTRGASAGAAARTIASHLEEVTG